ncbi:DUF2975 domain-containing protein [Flavobacterium magnum]|nr:DUF2975 domain-containing protein [Flavobacterium magnum]
MRKLNILKTLIDLSFLFSLLAVAGMTIFVPIYLSGSADEGPLKINGQEVSAAEWGGKLVIMLGAAGGLFFVYAIYLLRKTVAHFRKREIFHEDVIRYFNAIGKCIITSTLLTHIPLFFYNMLHRNHLGIQIDGGGFDSLLLSISLGLFFMVLAEAFKIAKNLKEENELTV